MEKEQCEAVYGDKRCENEAKYTRISQCEIYRVCGDCAKKITRQNKVNTY